MICLVTCDKVSSIYDQIRFCLKPYHGGESVLTQSGASEETVLSTFFARKILTLDELS